MTWVGGIFDRIYRISGLTGVWGSEGGVGGVTFLGDATGDLFDGSGWGGVFVW